MKYPVYTSATKDLIIQEDRQEVVFGGLICTRKVVLSGSHFPYNLSKGTLWMGAALTYKVKLVSSPPPIFRKDVAFGALIF